MRRLFTILATFSLTLPAFPATGAPHYEIRLQLSPEQESISVSGKLSFLAAEDGMREAQFLLNRSLEITSAECDQCERYSFDTSKTGIFMYAREASPLVLHFRRPLKKGETVQLRFAYAGRPVPPPFLEGSLGPTWVELALYTAWFPMQPDLGRFTYDVEVEADPAWLVSGGGRLSREEEASWRLRQDTLTGDINVVASRALKSRTISGSGTKVRIDYVGLDDAMADSMATRSAAIVQQFTEWFGRAASDELTVVVAERTRGGGYARPGFICYERAYMSRLSEVEMTSALAHEIGHLWWTLGPVETWEDWLNESFAEYSALMMVRQEFGLPAFEKYLVDFEKESSDTPAIRGLDRQSEPAYTVLYRKGPLVLRNLERSLGLRGFLDFLAALVREHIGSTDRLLAELEKQSSPEVRQQLERMLATTGAVSAQEATPRPIAGTE